MDLSSDQAVTIECKLGAVNSFLNLLCAQVDLAGEVVKSLRQRSSAVWN